MIKNFIKKLDQTILFNFVKKIKNKFDDLKNFTTHERFVKKISKKTDLKHVTILDNDKKNDLSKLCEHHGSDKGYINFHRENLWPWNPHTYTNVYDNLFNHCRESVKLVFECGIGTTNERISCNMSSGGKPGASLKVWKDYFSNAEIFGADIDKSILFSENRIKTFYVDQLDNNKIYAMWNSVNRENFDLIVDDGLHTYEAAHNFFKASFDKLKKGGIYIIEDVSSSYFEKLFDSLKKFSPEGIVLFDKNQFWYGNNLIIIRKK
jgi:hypothetical protein